MPHGDHLVHACPIHPSSPMTEVGCVLCEGRRLGEHDRAMPRVGLRRPKVVAPPNETRSRLRFKRAGGLSPTARTIELDAARPVGSRERLADGSTDFGAAVDPWFYELRQR